MRQLLVVETLQIPTDVTSSLMRSNHAKTKVACSVGEDKEILSQVHAELGDIFWWHETFPLATSYAREPGKKQAVWVNFDKGHVL